MVSRNELRSCVKWFGLHSLDEQEQIAKSIISEAEMSIQRLTESKQCSWRGLIRECQSKIRRKQADLRRIQEVREEVTPRETSERRDV